MGQPKKIWTWEPKFFNVYYPIRTPTNNYVRKINPLKIQVHCFCLFKHFFVGTEIDKKELDEGFK